jgi:hypothetical protein
VTFVITATVITNDPNQASLAAEVFARAGAGLVLDGVSVNVAMMIPDEQGDDEEAVEEEVE